MTSSLVIVSQSRSGAGSLKTIELKGTSLGKTKSFTYTTETITKEDVTNRRIFSEVSQTTEDIELRDNTANLVVGFYKNTNGTGYITLPRAFSSLGEDAGAGNTNPPGPQYTNILWNTFDSDTYGYKTVANLDYYLRSDLMFNPYSQHLQVLNDNTKYTIMLSRYSKLGNNRGSGEINGGVGEEPAYRYTVAVRS